MLFWSVFLYLNHRYQSGVGVPVSSTVISTNIWVNISPKVENIIVSSVTCIIIIIWSVIFSPSLKWKENRDAVVKPWHYHLCVYGGETYHWMLILVLTLTLTPDYAILVGLKHIFHPCLCFQNHISGDHDSGRMVSGCVRHDLPLLLHLRCQLHERIRREGPRKNYFC